MNAALYRVFGLTVSSELDLQPFPPGEGPPAVFVRRADVPEHLEEPAACGAFFEAAPDRLLLRIPGIARFLAAEGRDVGVDADPLAEPEDVLAVLLGSAFGALLMQRGLAPLHASAVHTERGAVLFAGPSGMGKSTLAAAFGQRGYDVLTDDVAAIETSPAGVYLARGRVRVFLLPAAISRLGVPQDGLALTRKRAGKFSVPVPVGCGPDRVPVHALYELSSSSDDEVTLTDLRGLDKIETLSRHTYRSQYMPGLGLVAGHFGRLGMLARRSRVVRVVRPAGGFQIERLVRALEQDFRFSSG